jgi:hypothetical protein
VFPYCRKLAAANQFSKLLEFGFPNLETRSPSEVTVCIEPTGPFSNAPAIAPIDVATAGITFVKHDGSDQGGLHTAISNGVNVRRRWRYYDLVASAPGTSSYVSDRGGSNDEMHIVVIDEDGDISGKAGEILEVYDAVSKASDAKTDSGDNNYYVDVLYNSSNKCTQMNYKEHQHNSCCRHCLFLRQKLWILYPTSLELCLLCL